MSSGPKAPWPGDTRPLWVQALARRKFAANRINAVRAVTPLHVQRAWQSRGGRARAKQASFAAHCGAVRPCFTAETARAAALRRWHPK